MIIKAQCDCFMQLLTLGCLQISLGREIDDM